MNIEEIRKLTKRNSKNRLKEDRIIRREEILLKYKRIIETIISQAENGIPETSIGYVYLNYQDNYCTRCAVRLFMMKHPGFNVKHDSNMNRFNIEW